MSNAPPSRRPGFRSAHLARIALGLALASLTACVSSGPLTKPRVALADAYDTPPGTVSGESPDPQWWHAFGDPTLDALVAAALHDNPDLAAAEAQVRRARAAATVAGAAGRPAVNASARVADDRLSRNGENLALVPFNPPKTGFTDYRVGLDASWELDLAGRTRSEVDAALARYGSALESAREARVVIASEVASAYLDVRLAQSRLSLARERQADLAEVARLSGLARSAGVVGDDEHDHALADAAAAASSVASLEAAADGGLYALSSLTAITAADLRGRLEPIAPCPSLTAAVPVGLPSDLLRRRPDIRRAEQELAAATADVGGAVAAQYPRVSLVAAGGLDSVRRGDLTASASRYWTLAPQLAIPLWTGGRLRAQVKMAEAARDAAVARYRGTVLQAFADAESSIARLAAARTRLRESEVASSAVAGMLRSAEAREHAGESSHIEVLLARRGDDDAREALLIAKTDAARAYVALHRALGGGWAESAETPSASP